ncbi:Toll-like receptor 8 [Collichthys lucidus]|uniref:Toll-like receptor 8 n=1 Tax=Collichthys lucidus TaxID=240159 RepID=A0A4U5U1D7_COLLU|nr:Toll-like receptor 8 [Collichthys lucidus]
MWMMPQFPCDVDAYNTSKILFDCRGRRLRRVPYGITPNATELDLSENFIHNVSFHSSPELLNLTLLNLSWANKEKPVIIEVNAFKNLTKLYELRLQGNCLTRIPDNLPRSVRKLGLNNNKIMFLDNSSLAGITNVTHLWLSKNCYIWNPCEKSVEIMDNSFEVMTKLRVLDLSYNNLTKVPKGLPKSLEVLMSIGPDTLSPLYELKNLSVLNLGTNFIIQSNSSVMSKFSKMKMIYLAENRLYPIPVKNPPHPSEGYNQRSDLSISPLVTPRSKDFRFEVSHSFVKAECFNAGRVLILSSNNLFFISPKQFDGYGNIACLNLSGNGFSSALNGTEFSLLPNLTYLDLSCNKIDLAYDHAFTELKKLEVLDLSHNSHYFEAFGVTNNLNFTKNLPVLRVLNMSHNSISRLTTKQMYSKSLTELRFSNNKLGILWKERDGSYKMLFTNLTNLTILDISYNGITKIPDNIYEYLPRNLTKLYVNHNSLTDFKWDYLKFFHQLQTLDLSYNKLRHVRGINSNFSHTNLTFLDLSHNNIFHLDNGLFKHLENLKALSLSYNKLTIINQSTFQLGPKNQIKTLYLQRNPFQCTCDSLDFILWIEDSDIKIPRLTTEVICITPENQRGQALIGFDINQCVNDSEALLIYILTHACIGIFMFVTTVAHLFYWDASYVLHYMKAKMKGYSPLSSPDSAYDVFVTYDTTDPHVSEWVMRNLRVKLEEEGEKHLPLCLEERDWPPGVPLVDNLTQSIRYSHKTLFVLTEGYVKTGVFKLAMYLAHQRLLDENVDVIVLLMLEPVLQHSHFLRLRRRLCGESVVEWPRTAAAEPWFWQNLRNVVRVDNQAMYNKAYSKYFTSK